MCQLFMIYTDRTNSLEPGQTARMLTLVSKAQRNVFFEQRLVISDIGLIIIIVLRCNIITRCLVFGSCSRGTILNQFRLLLHMGVSYNQTEKSCRSSDCVNAQEYRIIHSCTRSERYSESSDKRLYVYIISTDKELDEDCSNGESCADSCAVCDPKSLICVCFGDTYDNNGGDIGGACVPSM